MPGPRTRRRWLIGLVVAWIIAVAGLAAWSVRRDPATVPEQRTIAQAVPALQRATGAVFAAAGGSGRAVVLGELSFSEECRVTPVRDGLVGARDVTVYVRTGEARAGLEAIAAGLPATYRADVAVSRAGTRFSLHADAGNFIGIDADADADAREVTVRASTGCRPDGSGDPAPADPAPGPPPAVLEAVLRELGATSSGPPATRAVPCPAGDVAGTYIVDGVSADPTAALRSLGAGASVVRDDDSVRAYRAGTDSVVVVPDGRRWRLSVSAPCST